MSGTISLDDLRGAYKRTSSRIYRILEDGYDFAVENLIIDALARDALVVDAAFFVLVFGQIETRVNALMMVSMTSEHRRTGVRRLDLDRRLASGLPGAVNAELRRDIADWSKIRNAAAHGEALAGRYAMARIFERAFELEAILSNQLVSLTNPGEETQ